MNKQQKEKTTFRLDLVSNTVTNRSNWYVLFQRLY